MTLRERILLETRLWRTEKENLDKSFFKNLTRRSRPSILWIEPFGNVAPVTELTNTEPDEVMVYRNLGGQVRQDDASFMAVLEFFIEQPDAEYIVICGHSNGPGIRDVVAGVDKGPYTARWMEDVRDLYEQHAGSLASLSQRQREKKVSELNVRQQLQNLGYLDIVQRAWASGRKLVLLGWYFDLHKGELHEVHSITSRDLLTEVGAAS